MNPCVLHVSADYPDVYQPNKTPVIHRLVESLEDYSRNIVISINRVGRPALESVQRAGDVFSLCYFSPPLGLLQSLYLDRLAGKVIALLERDGIRPSVAIGHKFTIESCLVQAIAKYFDIPYVAAFMGNSDRKIFQLKPHYHKRYQRVASEASAIVFSTPWCHDYFEKRLLRKLLHTSDKNIKVIPYISAERCQPAKSVPRNPRHFVAVCRLDVWKIKNLPRLIEAVASLRSEAVDWKLDIVGTGSAAAKSAVLALIEEHGVADGVRMLGGKTREQIDALLPDYSAMVLPSYPESFGLVYLEALLQGVPIMTARDSGFDGYFAEEFPGVAVPHNSVDEIKNGLRSLAERGNDYRDIIARSEVEFSRFDRSTIVDGYKALLGV